MDTIVLCLHYPTNNRNAGLCDNRTFLNNRKRPNSLGMTRLAPGPNCYAPVHSSLGLVPV